MFIWEKYMRLITKVCLLSLLLVFTLGIAAQESSGSEQISDVTAALIKSYNSGDYVAASELFHIPASYTEEQVSQETEAVVKVLELLRNEFGKIKSYRSPSGPFSFFKVMFGTGDLRYWKKHPNLTRAVYEVEFSKLGKGYVVIALVNLKNKIEVREIAYGLHKSRPAAEDTVTAIKNKVTALFQPGE